MRPLSFLLLALLCGCNPPEAPKETPTVTAPSLEPVESGGLIDSAAASLQATLLEVENEIQQQDVVEIPPPPPPKPEPDAFEACAVKLITRWEVSGVAVYNRKWQGVYYPGGVSGPTWGIGWDGGHQTQHDNAKTWWEHPDVARLATTSGVIGESAKQRIGEWKGIRTPYEYAAKVFVTASLPAYTEAARRALGPGFVSLPSPTRCALTSLGYNRGWLTTGDRRREIRNLRDVCMKEPDTAPTCVANELRSMKRLWPTVPGLQARREDEARVAESL